MNIKVIIPTYNAGNFFDKILNTVINSEGIDKNNIFIIDSSSEDGTIDLIKKYNIRYNIIHVSEFSHGKTRNVGVKLAGTADYIVFLTQDALPASPSSIWTLCKFLEQDKNLAAAYGRQLPNSGVDILTEHARLYNYPAQSHIFSIEDKKRYGIKTAFFSNSFAAYRYDVFNKLGGFLNVNFGEDTCMAAKMLMEGYKIGYCAEAEVYHSRKFSLFEDFRRYSATGRFHRQESWLLYEFGKCEGEGVKFVSSEIKYCISKGRYSVLPIAIIKNLFKFLSYKYGYYF